MNEQEAIMMIEQLMSQGMSQEEAIQYLQEQMSGAPQEQEMQRQGLGQQQQPMPETPATPDDAMNAYMAASQRASGNNVVPTVEQQNGEEMLVNKLMRMNSSMGDGRQGGNTLPDPGMSQYQSGGNAKPVGMTYEKVMTGVQNNPSLAKYMNTPR